MSLHSPEYLNKFNLKSHIGGGIFDSLTLTCRGILAQKAQGLCKDLHDIHKIRGGVNEVFTALVPHLNGRASPYATVPEPGSRGIGILARLPPPMEHRLHVAAMPLPRCDFVIFYATSAGNQLRVEKQPSSSFLAPKRQKHHPLRNAPVPGNEAPPANGSGSPILAMPTMPYTDTREHRAITA